MTNINLPKYLNTLEFTSPIISHAVEVLKKAKSYESEKLFKGSPYFKGLEKIGENTYAVVPNDDLYFRVLTELAGVPIATESDIVAYVSHVSGIVRQCERFNGAVAEMEATGYGVVQPEFEQFKLDKPQLHKNGKSYGVKLRATAPSVHLVRVDVGCEVNPIIGEQTQSEEMLKYLSTEYETNPKTVWETPIFGKSLDSIVREEIATKSVSMPAGAKVKLQKTLTKIVNNGKGGVICILL
jgi:stage IV sporulation protein A